MKQKEEILATLERLVESYKNSITNDYRSKICKIAWQYIQTEAPQNMLTYYTSKFDYNLRHEEEKW
jgi:hypothetical protein